MILPKTLLTNHVIFLFFIYNLMKREDADINIELNEKQLKTGPRSKLMEAVLILLLARPLRTSEIAVNLGLETKYVSSYLSYWRKKGLVYQEAGRWHLSSQGEDLAKEIIEERNNSKFIEYLAFAKQILNENVKQTMNNKKETKENKEEKEFLSFIDDLTSTRNKKQQKGNLTDCISDILEKIDEEEKELLIFLLNKYKQWGSTYVYLDQIQEEFNADTGWLFKVLRKLQTKRILYLYHDPKLGLRIGFTQQLKDRINNC
ncbi:WhiP protein [Sulfurisphaera tokodaii str. 7]|uniref:WhiP protein n=2 Tax=Sulfurisphaera tokodaii TaxID=111955 RepID=Q971Y0_SULTO|nr:WhiP protein [Sulfurisphaera tokodaii str. 7]